MVLIGMLDSPYVRRCAVSMKLMGVPFEHRPLSVFRTFEQFRAINPIVKAPTLVCDDGAVMMDSTLILDYIESMVEPAKRLTPANGVALRESLRITGIALAAADKGVQVHYEKTQRPENLRYEKWLERIVGQTNAAYAELEGIAAKAQHWLQGERITAADVITAISWRFGQHYLSAEVPAARYPALAAFSRRAETLPEFVSSPLD
jgi:glutathione S-transferase